MPMIRAMATETVVDPAMANWRSPIWPTKHTPNNPARDRTDRTGNHKARTRSSSGTDHVGTCGSRDRCDCHDDRDCEHKVAHLISPPEEILLCQLNAQNMTPGPVASPTVAVPLSSLTQKLRQLGDVGRDSLIRSWKNRRTRSPMWTLRLPCPATRWNRVGASAKRTRFVAISQR